MRGLGRTAILAMGLLWSGMQAAVAVEFDSRFSTWVAPENPKCTCRFEGEHLPLGSRRCLQTPRGLRTAECVTEQNVTSWRPTDEPCPQAWLVIPGD